MRRVPSSPKPRHVLLAGLLCACGAVAAGATEITWSGQVRVRAEGSDRKFRGQRVDWDVVQRTRIGLSARIAPEVLFFVQAQDSRLWGAEAQTLADLNNVDLHQGYAQIERQAGGALWRVRAGRQELYYGDERIVGPVGFSNVGRSFDALQVRMQRGPLTADVIGARLADRAATPGNDDLLMTYNRMANAAGDGGVEFYALYRATPGTAFETTLGERLFGSHGRLSAEQEFAYMTGTRGGADLSAYLATGKVAVRAHARVTLAAALDVFSGDDPGDADVQFFDTGRIFATAHKFYGLMDVVEGLAGSAGLMDPYGTVIVSGPRGLATRLDVHAFRVHEKGTGDASLGTELDLTLKIPVASRASLQWVGTLFVPGSRLEARGLDRNAVWGYVHGLVDF